MAAPALTARAIANLKPTDARQEKPDGSTKGLYYTLQPSGHSSWCLRYRQHGKSRKLTLGPHPAIDLPTARSLARAALTKIALGEDPAAAKQSGDLIEYVVDLFITRYARVHTRSWRKTERLLQGEVVAPWKGRKLSTITRRDIHHLLDAIVDRGVPIAANRTLSALRKMLKWSVSRGLIEQSPAEGINRPSPEKPRERVLNISELRMVWKDSVALGWPFGDILRLLILTGARRSEIAELPWDEVDLETGLWTLPAGRAKNGRALLTPLPEAALEILRAAPRTGGRFVFSLDGKQPVVNFTRPKRKVGAGLPPWVIHDLRRSFATGLATEIATLPHVVEAILNHSPGQIARIYNLATYLPEKRVALESWAAFVLAKCAMRS
jgi:integrase